MFVHNQKKNIIVDNYIDSINDSIKENIYKEFNESLVNNGQLWAINNPDNKNIRHHFIEWVFNVKIMNKNEVVKSNNYIYYLKGDIYNLKFSSVGKVVCNALINGKHIKVMRYYDDYIKIIEPKPIRNSNFRIYEDTKENRDLINFKIYRHDAIKKHGII